VFATDDTIVAIATPPGRGGIGVVRLSGPHATSIAGALLQLATPLVARHATFGRIQNPALGELIDQVVTTWFAAPHSYTGEDVVEISGHGSPLLMSRIVAAAVDQGARPAEPGEFTLRAYLNGRIDLPQAEAVADLVDAVTPLQARAAMDQLEGTLTAAISRIDATLFDLCARLEASLDFPEEGFHFITRPEAESALGELVGQFDRLIDDGRTGRVIREGRQAVIVGRPNAGKSSLFNALLGAPRAIVTEIPGTTRDLLTERVDVNGIALTLVDTAGQRDARDEIEAEGVRRARQAQRVASLTLVVVDGSQPLSDADRALVGSAHLPAVVVQSKADLPQRWDPAELAAPQFPIVQVSVLSDHSVAILRQRIVESLTDREDLRDAPVITNIRHLSLVEQARAAVDRARNSLSAGSTEELILTDLTRARASLEEISGRRAPDDLLRHIFTRFCIGK
jgi:tRNA modification GTPase